MASTTSLTAQSLSIFTARKEHTSTRAHASKHTPAALPSRRQCLLLFTATTALKAIEMPARAANIPLFGLRKNLKKVEEEAEEIVKEGFEAADKGLEAAVKGIEATERGIVTAEKGIEAAEKEIEAAVSFSGVAQAGAVAAAEVVGVLVATSIVNGILGPEAQKS